MPRYIIIETNTGYIWGDSADFAAGRHGEVNTPVDACRLLDESLGVHGRRYVEHARKSRFTPTDGYDVYRADIGGSEAVGVAHDGQDPEAIQEVIDYCEHVAFVTVDGESV